MLQDMRDNKGVVAGSDNLSVVIVAGVRVEEDKTHFQVLELPEGGDGDEEEVGSGVGMTWNCVDN